MTDCNSATIGHSGTGMYIDDGISRINFSEDEMEALILAKTHTQSIVDVFVNYCSTTIASGEIPSCFRQDLSPEQVKEVKEDLRAFQRNFRNAFSSLMLTFES